MKLTCAIIDDEPLAVELLESYVRKTPFLELKGAYNGGITALEALKTEPVDLLFCDIQMPELNGMELSRMLPARTRVVFTTAFDRYAVEGFRVGAVDYLLKPISYADFLTAANKAFEWFELKRRSVGKPSPAEAGPESIFVKTEYRLRQIELDKILYIEGLKDYVKIYVEDEPRPVLSLESLNRWKSSSPPSVSSGYTAPTSSNPPKSGSSSGAGSSSAKRISPFQTATRRLFTHFWKPVP